MSASQHFQYILSIHNNKLYNLKLKKKKKRNRRQHAKMIE